MARTINETVSIEYIQDFDQHYLKIIFSHQIPKSMFLPKLRYIHFIKEYNYLRVILDDSFDPSLKIYFLEFIESFVKSLDFMDQTSTLIKKFNDHLKSLITIGRKEKVISLNVARGFYGELLYLKECVSSQKYTLDSILEAWQRPSPTIHDFVFDDMTTEIKTVTKSNTTVRISSEHQLECLNDKPLELVIYTFDSETRDSRDSIGELFSELHKIFKGHNAETLFESKCFENKAYLGPENERLNYCFQIIDSNHYKVDQKGFPRIKRNQSLRHVSNISYDIDLSALDNFKIDSRIKLGL